MVQTIKDMLIDWNGTHTERAKLQHAYLLISLVGIMVAGLVGLLDYNSSRALLRICFAGLGIFAVNAITWALLFSLVLNKLPTKRLTRK